MTNEYTEQEKRAAAWIATEAMQGNENAQTVMNMFAEAEQLRTQQGGEAAGEVRRSSSGAFYVAWNTEDGYSPDAGTQLFTHPPAPVPENCDALDKFVAYVEEHIDCEVTPSEALSVYRAHLNSREAAQGGE